MFKTLTTLFKIACLFLVVALVLDLRYQGKSARKYAQEYGTLAFEWAYENAKGLVGKDIEDLAPKSVVEIPSKLKELAGEGSNQKVPPQNKPKVTSESVPAQKTDGLTDKDREKLKKLVQEKAHSKS